MPGRHTSLDAVARLLAAFPGAVVVELRKPEAQPEQAAPRRAKQGTFHLTGGDRARPT
jgi:hypothetical protein